VGLHRVLAWAALHSQCNGRLVKDQGMMLAEKGRLNEENLHLTH
jgi:uncharacterized membrane protein YcaP (DUF421 family)